MFVWIYALGTGALMLPEPCRRPALVAIAAMQTIILATQGRRAYSLQEWTRLLVDSAHECFAALEFLLKYKEDHDTRSTTTTFTPMARYVFACLYLLVYVFLPVYACLPMQYKSYMLACICLCMHACPCNINHICLLVYACACMLAHVI